MVIDEAAAGKQVYCPQCSTEVIVPSKNLKLNEEEQVIRLINALQRQKDSFSSMVDNVCKQLCGKSKSLNNLLSIKKNKTIKQIAKKRKTKNHKIKKKVETSLYKKSVK